MNSDSAQSLGRRKNQLLLVFLVCAVVFEFLRGLMGEEWESLLLILDMVAFYVILVRWTRLDAAEHDYQLWKLFVPLLVIFPGPLIIMPIYFVKSRGWRDGLMASGRAFIFGLLLVLAGFLAYVTSSSLT